MSEGEKTEVTVRQSWRWWLTLGIVLLIPTTGLIYLYFVASDYVMRFQIVNTIKQLSMAADHYHDKSSTLPSSTRNESGIAMHGWQTMLLPYMYESDLYDQIDFEQPWNADSNAELFKTKIFGYLRSSRRVGDRWMSLYEPGTGFALTSFSANRHIIDFEPAMTHRQIQDGLSNTIMFGEIREQFPPWGKPGNSREPALPINKASNGFGGFTKGGCEFVMADGHVAFISENVNIEVLHQLATPNGGERIEDF
ncbi:DUF1559 family PulG-like putative transporter [Lacunimicrobium album]